MKSLLRELYSGKIFPAEQIAPQDPEYGPLNRTIDRGREYIRKALEEEDRKRFEDWESLCMDSAAMDAEESFVCGFRLGARMMTEILADKADKEEQAYDG